MDELTPEARDLLAAARPAFSPSAEQLARLRARMPSVPSDAPAPDVGGGGTAAGSSWTFYVVVAAVVAVIAVVLATRPEPEPPRIEAPSVAPEDDTEAAPIELARVPQRPAIVEAPAVAPAVVAPPASAPRSRARSLPRVDTREPVTPLEPAPTPEPTPAPEADELAAQLELIGGARRAINAEQWSRAHELVEEYERRFPAGAFAGEAAVLDLLSACADDPSADAQARARRYLARTKAPFAERVRRHCLPGGE